MSSVFLVIVIVLMVLAVMDLVVGVANDAVNFLNSSIGSKVAPLWVILTVASIGVMLGTLFSSGMMEIARSGVFHPGMLTFPSVMMLFLAVMITDVILLDLFNTFGLPTSTTVSMVFELLGAAVAVSLFTIWQNNSGNLGEYINTGKALAIISGIFISIGIAFVTGSLVMWLSRLIFSFQYKKTFQYLGAIWGGIALTSITYFAVFKGLKGSAIVSKEFMELLNSNMLQALFYAFIGWTALMAALQYVFRVNILRIIVLMGTLALALAFASNDLVNFIGVFMAGLNSYQIASGVAAAGGDVNELMMSDLSKPVIADWRYLLGAGIIMILALWFSKKSRSVTETEVNLASQKSGVERFESSGLSRSLVRGAMDISRTVKKAVPESVLAGIDKRFTKIDIQQEDAPSFDLIRASVNLTVAALLISLGTSLKLPLSTTYVTFMVAMGTSLADRAWGRESAVYRINGVLTVIGGWLLTALAAFTIALLVGFLLMYGQVVAMVALVTLIVFLLIKSSAIHQKRTEKQQLNGTILSNENEIINLCTQQVKNAIGQTLTIYEQTINALTVENRKELKEIAEEAEMLNTEYKNKRTYEVVPTIQSISANELDIEKEYVETMDYTYEITKALRAITKDSYNYIDNNHKGLDEDQENDLRKLKMELTDIYNEFINMVESVNYSAYEALLKKREHILETFSKLTKRQIKRARDGKSGTRNSVLFLNILNETKIIVLQSFNLMRAQKNMMQQPKLKS